MLESYGVRVPSYTFTRVRSPPCLGKLCPRKRAAAEVSLFVPEPDILSSAVAHVQDKSLHSLVWLRAQRNDRIPHPCLATTRAIFYPVAGGPHIKKQPVVQDLFCSLCVCLLQILCVHSISCTFTIYLNQQEGSGLSRFNYPSQARLYFLSLSLLYIWLLSPLPSCNKSTPHPYTLSVMRHLPVVCGTDVCYRACLQISCWLLLLLLYSQERHPAGVMGTGADFLQMCAVCESSPHTGANSCQQNIYLYYFKPVTMQSNSDQLSWWKRINFSPKTRKES